MSYLCTYTRTATGRCMQPKSVDSQYCYFHDKVVEGLIETDEMQTVRDMPNL